jgi:hypothetical protein
VRRADVGDHAPVGRGDQGQGGDLAGVVHAHLDDRDLVLGFEAQQLQGQAEAVVEIALRLEHVELCAQGRGNRFLGGGLAGRAGDGHHALAPSAANVRGQGLQRAERIFGDEQRHGQRGVGQRGHSRARDHRGHSSAFHCGGHKVVAVVALAAHREEELARGDGARVNRVAADHQRAGVGHAGRRFQHRARADGRFRKCEFHCLT